MTRPLATEERLANARPYVAIVMTAQLPCFTWLLSSIPGSKWSGSNDVQVGWFWIGLILLSLSVLVGRFIGGSQPPSTGPR